MRRPSSVILQLTILCWIQPTAWAFLVRTPDSLQFRDASDRTRCRQASLKKQNIGPLYISSGLNLGSMSGNLISQLAVFAIQVCLKEYSDVSCDVSSLPQDLFQGKIGPVTVKGKDWRSSRDLTCKAIEASVDMCKLDIGRVMSEQLLVLTSPAEGKAMVALTAQDFGNFITHPRFEKAKQQVIDSAGISPSSRIEFSRHNVAVDPTMGTVTFFASCAGVHCQCVLKRAKSTSESGWKAVVDVTTVNGDGDDQSSTITSWLSKELTNFFNRMIFEMYDGLFLSFSDMMVTDKGKSPSVLLALNIRVERFPSPAALSSSF